MKTTIASAINKLPYRLYRTFLGDFAPVFMLHRIATEENGFNGHESTHIRWCLEHLRKNRYHPLSLTTLMDYIREGRPFPERAVAFTIDDGFADNIVQAGSLFSEYDVPLTCFLITGFIDGSIWPWDDQIKFGINETKQSRCNIALPNDLMFAADFSSESRCKVRTRLRGLLKALPQENLYPWLRDTFFPALNLPFQASPPAQFAPASWDDIASFVASGHEVAPHTVTHRILSQLNDEQAKQEILVSWQQLQKRVPSATKILAYPTGRSGDFSPRDAKICQENGFVGAVSAVTGFANRQCDPFAVPRFSFPTAPFDFLQHLGAIEVIKNRVRG